MSKLKNRLIWGLAAFVAALTVAGRLVPLEDASPRLRAPSGGVGMQVVELPLTQWEADFFGSASVRRWMLSGNGPSVIATVVDGTRNRRAVHDPGFCFRGAGWEIEGERALELPHGLARIVRLRRDGETADAVYWFSDGLSAHGDARRYWIDATLRRLSFGHSGPEPVLVMLVPVTDSPAEWTQWLRRWPELTRY